MVIWFYPMWAWVLRRVGWALGLVDVFSGVPGMELIGSVVGGGGLAVVNELVTVELLWISGLL